MFRLRRAAGIAAITSALALALASCAPSQENQGPATTAGGAETTPATGGEGETTAPEGGEAAGGEFKVDYISPLTGAVAVAGQEMHEGWELYWDINGTDVNGVTVTTILEDDAGNPDTSLQKARRLAEQENVDLLVGPLLANTAIAVSAYAVDVGVPNMHPVAAGDSITQGDVDPLVMRVGSLAASQMNFPAGDWAYNNGYETAVTLCPDYAFGWDSCGGFVRTFTEAGGEIAQQLWFPLGTQDFSPYVSQLQAAGADVVFVTTAGGADGPNFFSTYNDFGLLGELPILTNCCAVDQATIRALGVTMLGVQSVSYYAEGRDAPEVDEFVAAYQERYDGKIPSLNVAGGYVTAHVVAMTLEQTGADVQGEAFIAAARALELPTTAFGPITFDEYNNPVMDIYIREIQQMDDGTIRNVDVETYDSVSQFWTYDPDEYMATVPYSRDNNGDQSNG